MKLVLDQVSGHEIDRGVYDGRVIRMGLITGVNLPLAQIDQTVLIRALATQGMPQLGDAFIQRGQSFGSFVSAPVNPGTLVGAQSSSSDFENYFCKRHIIHAGAGARTLLVAIVYEYLGMLRVRDSSSLTVVPSQLSRKDFKPHYVTWTPPGGTPIKKVATVSSPLPMRHLNISRTISFQLASTVQDAFGSVNDVAWNGLPIGYWLFSDLDGDTFDNGITYTYTVVFSTKQWEDWSTIEFLEDDNGQVVPVDPVAVAALRNKPYQFGDDTSVNGVTKSGEYPLASFSDIFGYPQS